MSERAGARIGVAEWIHREHGPAARVAIGDAGIVGYVLDNPIEDLFGLNTRRFTHELSRNRRAHVREVVAARPELVVLVSRERARFEPRYATDRHAFEAPGFAEEYALAHRVLSAAESYHYFVFALGPGPDEPVTETRRDPDPAAAIRRARRMVELAR
jgi:hypothetical protein